MKESSKIKLKKSEMSTVKGGGPSCPDCGVLLPERESVSFLCGCDNGGVCVCMRWGCLECGWVYH